nr:hypothetical protein [Tanacetum cinerariifolium]
KSLRQILDNGDLRDYWVGISSVGDFFGMTPSYISIRDLILWLCHKLIMYSIARRRQAPEEVIVTDLFYLRGMDVDSVNILYILARSKRQLDVAVVALEAAKDAHFVDEDASAIPTPIHVPQLPPPAAKIINTKDGQPLTDDGSC